MLRERRRLKLAQRLQCHIAHDPIGVLEPRDDGISMLRERRRLKLAQRLQCLIAHNLIGVLEPRDHSVGLLGDRRRIQLGQRGQRGQLGSQALFPRQHLD